MSASGADSEAGAPSPLDPKALRQALGCFATGVTVITTLDHKDRPVGVTANSFNAVSLDPPLVLFSLDRRAHSLWAFLSAQHFAVNVLAADQGALSDRFARASAEKWQQVDYRRWDSGCPILPGCAANFDCSIRYTHNGGDHVIFVGEVTALACDPARPPLLFHGGRYGALAPGG